MLRRAPRLGPAVAGPGHRLLFTAAPLPVRRPLGPGRARCRGGRPPEPGRIRLLDTFLKLTGVEGSLVAKAPFGLRADGVFFRDDHSVYQEKNRMVGEQREQYQQEENARRREDSPFKKLLLEEGQLAKEIAELAALDLEVREKREKERQEMDEARPEIMSSLNERLGGEKPGEPLGAALPMVAPLHMNLYGLSNQQVISYSIKAGPRSDTHVFVSDGESYNKVEEQMFLSADTSGAARQLRPAGLVSLMEALMPWRDEDAGKAHGDINNSFKIYCPDHLLKEGGYLRANLLVPTLMERIYMETEGRGPLELDGSLMDQLQAVGLASEEGRIRPKDVWASSIQLASRRGQIDCRGTIEGDIWAESRGHGGFVARELAGPKLKVTTELGDIQLLGDCFSEEVELYTTSGHIHVKSLFGRARCLVRGQGRLSVTVAEGSLSAVVRAGDVAVRVERLLEDSVVEVGEGQVTVELVRDKEGDALPCRVSLNSPRNIISAKLLGAGVVSVGAEGEELFTLGEEAAGHILTVVVRGPASSIALREAEGEL